MSNLCKQYTRFNCRWVLSGLNWTCRKWRIRVSLKTDWSFWRGWVVLSGLVFLQLWWVLAVLVKSLSWMYWLVGKLVDILRVTSPFLATQRRKKLLLEFLDTVRRMISTLLMLLSMSPWSTQLGCSCLLMWILMPERWEFPKLFPHFSYSIYCSQQAKPIRIDFSNLTWLG